MEIIRFDYPAKYSLSGRAHIGVVGSGDLEVLLEPSTDGGAHVLINTSVAGFEVVWKLVLDRFFNSFQGAAHIEINDFGATPGTVMLRLEQAAETVLT